MNVEYLNRKLQEKIYLAENPLSYDKLIKQSRLQIFQNLQEYLANKKVKNITIQNYERELFITSHESMRLGDAPYLLQYLNSIKSQ